MPQSYKNLKEAFVANHTGGTILEINLVTAVAPVSLTASLPSYWLPRTFSANLFTMQAAVLLWSVLQARHTIFTPYTPSALSADFLLSVIAILLATTVYSSIPTLLNLLLLAPALLILALPLSAPKKAPNKPPQKHNANGLTKPAALTLSPFPIRPFITVYRGSMLVITCLAILAVDFRIFPRRFAKVENWGTSLMDVGVGSFVFSAGVIGAKPFLKTQILGDFQGTRLGPRLMAAGRHSFPLLILGLLRLWSVKGLDYAEHVSEYGVHWNFFFTLGFLPPFVALFQSLFALIPSFSVLAVLLGVAYEIALDITPLGEYVLTAQRTSLISQNREGIFSFFGYLAIFLAGVGAGRYVLPRQPQGSASTSSPYAARRTLLIRLGTLSLVHSGLLAFSLSYSYGLGLGVSRRLANLPYILWICAFNTAQMTAFCLIETLAFPSVHRVLDATVEHRETTRATSRILAAFNRNGLAIFLVANLLTGLVNLTTDTLGMGTAATMVLLLGYAAVITGIALGLDARDITIKL
jgi:phosphatidylinositol glycan class W